MHYLSSCSIVKNEKGKNELFYRSFIEIHRKLGVEFFLFFDRSDEPLGNILSGEKDVHVIHFPEPNRHAAAWRDGLQWFMGKSKFVQFIDIDQVLFPTQTDDLKVLFKDYEDVPAIGFNWHTFGSNGHIVEPPAELNTYQAYTKRAAGNAGINNHIQTVINLEYNNGILPVENCMWPDPHHPTMKYNVRQVNEHKLEMPHNSPFNVPPTHDKAFICHYYTRSREYWAQKLLKQRADTGTPTGSMADFDHHQTYLNEVEDTRIKDFWEKHCK